MIRLKRVYEPPQRSDGYRILVDRLWPRGLTKEKSAVDLWLKELAPSDALRKQFCHVPEKWKGFQARYARELKSKKELVTRIREAEREHGTVTLLYAARDTQYNNAVALHAYLRKKRRA